MLTIIDKIASEKNDADTVAMGVFAVNAMVKKFPMLLKNSDLNDLNNKDSMFVQEIVSLKKHPKKVVKSAVAEFLNLLKQESMSKLKAKDPNIREKHYTDDARIKEKFDADSSEDEMPELEEGDEVEGDDGY